VKQRAYQERKIRRLFQQYDHDVIRSKAHYMDNQEFYNRLCIWGLTKLTRTGGSSGLPFAFYIDTFSRRQKERAYLFDIWASAGYRPFDLRVVFRGNSGKGLISYNLLENCYVVSPSELSQANCEELFGFLSRLPPFLLHVYPSSLFTFIELIGEDKFKRLPIRGVLAGSEVFPLNQKETFEQRFGIHVAHWYGHTEYATLARNCRHCGGFHFYPTYGFTELVPIENGRCRIVATSFNLVGTQFVRYDTGDLAVPQNRTCEQPFLSVAAIEGREQEYFLDSESQWRAFGPYLFGIHNEFWDRISAIQFQQKQIGWLDVSIVMKDSSHRIWLEDYLRKRFEVCELRFEYVNGIPTTAAGKHRYYVSLIQ
jgi:phenylacetate-CoA ligase